MKEGKVVVKLLAVLGASRRSAPLARDFSGRAFGGCALFVRRWIRDRLHEAAGEGLAGL